MTKRLSDTYQEILANPTNSKLWQSQIWQGPSQSDVASWQAQGYGVYQGKIRTVLSRDGRIEASVILYVTRNSMVIVS